MARKRQKKNKRLSSKSTSNTLRIIGGQWRSRKLSFSDAEGLRPTPDRIRETLFNWLQNDIHGAVCLDLFAGSGALGIEALSRGAKHVDFVEKDRATVNQLKANLELLKVSDSESKSKVHHDDGLEYLLGLHKMAKKGGGVLDIVFLDPPYRKGLLEQSLAILQEKSLINTDTLIYLEHESEESFDWGEFGLTVMKEMNAGQVKCYLLKGSAVGWADVRKPNKFPT